MPKELFWAREGVSTKSKRKWYRGMFPALARPLYPAVPMKDVIHGTAVLRLRTQMRRLSRKYCVQTVARLLSGFFELELSWASGRWDSAQILLVTNSLSSYCL